MHAQEKVGHGDTLLDVSGTQHPVSREQGADHGQPWVKDRLWGQESWSEDVARRTVALRPVQRNPG